MRRLVKAGDPKSRGQALGLLTKMLAWTAEAKCNVTVGLLREKLDAPNSKVILFSEFLAPLYALRQKLLHQSTVLEGSMSDSDRQVVIDRFQTEQGSHVLLCSRRAAGMSVTLTAADTCVFMGLPWEPESYKQSVSRIHRETQTRSTQAIFILAQRTYDESMLQRLYAKAGVIELAAGRPPLPEGELQEFDEMLKLLGGAQP
jgi:SWI/SNF-related matrix-associated actin-dependent regulator of chromatin subfamily A-like protein 1